MLKEKEIRVILSEEADEIFQELNRIVGTEKKKGIESSFHQTLLRSIKKGIELLKENPFAGNQIPKRLIPRKYIKNMMLITYGELN